MKIDRNTMYIIVFVVIVSVFLVLAITQEWFKPKGVPLGELEVKVGEGEVDVVNDTGEINLTQYKRIAENCYDRLSGWNQSGEYFIQTANELLSLNSNELRLVVNEYDKMYRGEYYSTLRKLLNGEYLACGEWYYFWYTSDSCELRRSVNEKLQAIGA